MALVLKRRHAVIVATTAIAIIAVHYWNTRSRTNENAPVPVQTSDPEPIVTSDSPKMTIDLDETETFRAFESGNTSTPPEPSLEFDEVAAFRAFESVFWDYSSSLEAPGYVAFNGVLYLGSGLIKVSATNQWLRQSLPKRERELDSVFNLWRMSVTPAAPVAVLISSEDNEPYMEMGFNRKSEIEEASTRTEETRPQPTAVSTTSFSRPSLRVVHQHSGTMPNGAFSNVRLQGKVLSRLRKGAIVQADGAPSFSTYRNVQWVTGIIYVQEHNSLIATYREAPISGEVAQAGEFRFEGKNSTIHVMKAWRFK